ncbi:hypothetical protein [Rubrivirga marina]|uniref:Uncharacterized protein n=1 Tax=Rubrivirga marina TaxID=1196024 RepID=A0A271J5H8_9BACT|nr:hypothetical protein [Rubrivirga marina]PAP78517.1 hypothetical protein BSZ37_19850 [Rubrivirga marina]
MPTTRDDRSAADRLLVIAERFAAQGRPAMAEAARRAAALSPRPSDSSAPGFRIRPRTDDADARR